MVASFGNRRSMRCLNGGGIVELSCCLFFKRHGADFLRFVFKMKPACASGRIRDSQVGEVDLVYKWRFLLRLRCELSGSNSVEECQLLV